MDGCRRSGAAPGASRGVPQTWQNRCPRRLALPQEGQPSETPSGAPHRPQKVAAAGFSALQDWQLLVSLIRSRRHGAGETRLRQVARKGQTQKVTPDVMLSILPETQGALV